MLRVKRVYEPPARTDGRRILIDRLWPRGLTKIAANVDRWERDLAPSSALRTWFGHDPTKYPLFREKYRTELRNQRDRLVELATQAEREPITLVFAARDAAHCNASVLQELLGELMRELRSGPHPKSDP